MLGCRELDHMLGSCSMASTFLGVQLCLAYIGNPLVALMTLISTCDPRDHPISLEDN